MFDDDRISPPGSHPPPFLNVFALIQAATNGGPFFSTEPMELYIYRNAFGANTGSFTEPRLGYASAAGVIFGVCIMAISLLLILARRAGSLRDLRGEGAQS